MLSANNILFTATIKVSSRETFLASFDVMKNVVGFQSLSILQGQNDINKFMIVEYWDNNGSHAKFVKDSPIAAAQSWLELLMEPPKVGFYNDIAKITST